MKTYILNHFRGNHPLWQSFWINGLLLTNLLVVLIAIIIARLTFPPDELHYEYVLYAQIPLLIWAYVGIWKSSSQYSIDAKKFLIHAPGKQFFKCGIVVVLKTLIVSYIIYYVFFLYFTTLI